MSQFLHHQHTVGLSVTCPVIAAARKMNKRAPTARLPFGRKPERNSMVLSATLNVRGLSLPDQTRIVGAAPSDWLHVSLHRAVVSRLFRT